MPPHLGAGAGQAIEDARTIGRLLAHPGVRRENVEVCMHQFLLTLYYISGVDTFRVVPYMIRQSSPPTLRCARRVPMMFLQEVTVLAKFMSFAVHMRMREAKALRKTLRVTG